MRRTLAQLLALSVIAVPGSSLPSALGAEAPGKLNVLFVISDDLRPELSCYGNAHVRTPNIDALAAAGVKFDHAYVQYPLCNPSRTSMLTGRYPTTTGVMDNSSYFGAIHPEFVSLPKHFKASGYATLRAGKIFHEGIDDTGAWTEGGEPRIRRDVPPAAAAKKSVKGKAVGLPQSRPPEEQRKSDRIVVLAGEGESHADYKTADLAIDYLRRHADKDEPFFLACGFVKPHSVPQAPKRFYDMYDVDKVPLPPDFAPTPRAPEGFPKASILERNIDLFVGREATPESARAMKRAYWASLTWMDWNLGRVVAELDRLGLRERTVVVFWGDHGYHLGEKGKWSKHQSLYEVVGRVPLIVDVPGAKSGGRACPRVVESIDIYPTLVELCGLPMPAGLDGRSLVPLLKDPEAPWDHPAMMFMGNAGRHQGTAVRDDGFRYAEYYDPERGGTMLFDEEADPHEMRNLAGAPEYAGVKTRLESLARKFRPRESRPGR